MQDALGITIHGGWPLQRWFGCFVNNHPIDPGSATCLCIQALTLVSKGASAKVSAIRLNPAPPTLRRLFTLSRNLCAFPKCDSPIIDGRGCLLAEVCHIEAANETGQRFNRDRSNEERRQFENLILLCRNHHEVTNNVNEYPTEVMQDMKATHEAVAIVGGSPDRELRERFVDLSLSANLQLPTNFKQLDLSGCEHLFFLEARKLMQAVAGLPNLTRSLYAHALAYSYVGDLYLYCDPVELEHRLGQTACQLRPHFDILQNHGLMWVPEYKEAWPNPSGSGCRSYFRQFDQDDSGIYFLWLMRTRYASEKTDLVDIIQNLNFNLLDL